MLLGISIIYDVFRKSRLGMRLYVPYVQTYVRPPSRSPSDPSDPYDRPSDPSNRPSDPIGRPWTPPAGPQIHLAGAKTPQLVLRPI